MINEDVKAIITETATLTAKSTLSMLKRAGRIKYYQSNVYKQTEELLYLYPNLPEGNEHKALIDKALEKIKTDDYYGVIESRYFDGMTIAEIAEIYDCQDRTIMKRKAKLVKILTAELFPEDVAKEILERG